MNERRSPCIIKPVKLGDLLGGVARPEPHPGRAVVTRQTTGLLIAAAVLAAAAAATVTVLAVDLPGSLIAAVPLLVASTVPLVSATVRPHARPPAAICAFLVLFGGVLFAVVGTWLFLPSGVLLVQAARRTRR